MCSKQCSVSLSSGTEGSPSKTHYRENYIRYPSEDVRPRSTKAPPPEVYIRSTVTPLHYDTVNYEAYRGRQLREKAQQTRRVFQVELSVQ